MQQWLTERKCRRCYYSRLIAEALLCVKNPPAHDLDTGQARWPTVKDDDICGQFHDARQNYIHTDSFGEYCKIPLTKGRFAKVDPEDYIWLSQFRWHCKVNINATYAVRTITIAGKSKRIYMHRLIMNTPPHLVCDHINHDGLDNRKQNLRNCTITQNNANSRSARGASSKYKGVSWNKKRKKWAAYIKKGKKQTRLGFFDDEVEAARTYDKNAAELFGEYAQLNFTNSKKL